MLKYAEIQRLAHDRHVGGTVQELAQADRRRIDASRNPEKP